MKMTAVWQHWHVWQQHDGGNNSDNSDDDNHDDNDDKFNIHTSEHSMDLPSIVSHDFFTLKSV